MRVIHWIAVVLVIVGALNWGMWGFFQIDVVATLFKGPSSAISRIIYSLVGLSGLWCISLFKHLACCSMQKKG